jgi:hypothetical protein
MLCAGALSEAQVSVLDESVLSSCCVRSRDLVVRRREGREGGRLLIFFFYLHARVLTQQRFGDCCISPIFEFILWS